ncbi:thioesterase II family protein [Streptomyces reniochalinae]|uniref:Thioesterase n=1 Tax=Streptomyces reniochalinae TaxID=2250578 RepID=A0A367EEU1_9ACTN|nr:thioesterase II family protein [Streptomyces reniochalinae]RCG16165.1 thioesterase [Streptomyces reniochalinae]
MTLTNIETELWLRRFHPAPDASTRLVCFPHAGGSASFYFPVSKTLSPDVDVLAVQYPGRQDRRNEPAVESIGELADLIAPMLRPLTDRPVAFFGHSMGAVIAFEVAQRLERDGVTPFLLFASGRRAPSAVRSESVHRESDDTLIAELQRLSGTDARMLGDEEVLRMILPSLRSDYKAIETYRCTPGARVSCPIDVLIGDSDPHASLDEAGAWSEHTTGPCDVEVFDGGHFYLNDHAVAVTDRVARRISALRAP